MDAKSAMALTYKMWINGNAYIPPQDLVIYEKAYKEVYEK